MIKSKLFEIPSQLISLIKYIPHYYRQRLDEITRIFEVEKELAKASSMDFVCLIRPVLKELSYMEIESFSVVYKKYLEEVICNISEGQKIADILNRYDTKLVEMRGRDK